MPGTVLHTLNFSSFNLQKRPVRRYLFKSSHFTNRDVGSERLFDSPKISQLLSGKAIKCSMLFTTILHSQIVWMGRWIDGWVCG